MKKTAPLTFISGGTNWSVEFDETSKEWRGNTDQINEVVKESDINLAKYLDQCVYLSGIQISSSIYATNETFDATKKRLNRLSSMGYFLRHYMKKDDLSRFPYYTVGPGAYPLMGKNTSFKHNFNKQHPAATVLKVLSCNQLAIKMNKFVRIKIDHSETFIYNANIEYIKRKYGDPTKNQDKIKELKLISIRNYEKDITELARQIYKVDHPVIVIAYAEEGLKQIVPAIRKAGNEALFRFTTDKLLFNPRQDLSQAFMKLDTDGRIVVDPVEDFK